MGPTRNLPNRTRVQSAGFEPATLGSVDRCSIQLSYDCLKKRGGERGIRTLDPVLQDTRLAIERLRPLGHLSSTPRRRTRRCQRTNERMAEEVGFEPTAGYPATVFKTAALSHSATPPDRGLTPKPRRYIDEASACQDRLWISDFNNLNRGGSSRPYRGARPREYGPAHRPAGSSRAPPRPCARPRGPSR